MWGFEILYGKQAYKSLQIFKGAFIECETRAYLFCDIYIYASV